MHPRSCKSNMSVTELITSPSKTVPTLGSLSQLIASMSTQLSKLETWKESLTPHLLFIYPISHQILSPPPQNSLPVTALCTYSPLPALTHRWPLGLGQGCREDWCSWPGQRMCRKVRGSWASSDVALHHHRPRGLLMGLQPPTSSRFFLKHNSSYGFYRAYCIPDTRKLLSSFHIKSHWIFSTTLQGRYH